jgi:hypothetical protein
VRAKDSVVLTGGVDESFTFTDRLKIPGTVGDPEMTPSELALRPAGKPVTDQVYGAVPSAGGCNLAV